MKPHQIAHVVHEANRAYQQEHADDPISGPWEQVSEHTRETVIAGVQGVLDGDTPAESHERWCKAKRAAGYTWGPRKDTKARTHPCLVPYADLMEHEKAKDRMFHAIVHALKDACE